MKEHSQNKDILAYLQAGHSLAPLDALRLFNCWALSSRISDLRKEGHNITSVMEKGENGKIYARYSLNLPRHDPIFIERGGQLELAI